MSSGSFCNDTVRSPSIRCLFLSVIAVIVGWNSPLRAATATHFSVTAPATATPLVPFSITVTALDASDTVDTTYRGTVHFSTTDAAGSIPGDYTFVSGDNGMHTFSVTLSTPCTQTVTAKDTSNSLITGTSNDINVIGPVTHFAVTAPATAAPGVPFAITVTALDASDTVDTAYRGTVHFSTSDAAGSIPADYSFMSGDNGVHTFSVTLRTPCTQTVSVKDTALSCVTGTSGDIDVIGPVTHFSVTAPATVVAGVPFVVTVTALDASDAVDTTYVGTVHFSKTDPGGILPANYQFVLADNGVHTFSVTLATVDSQMVTVADTTLRCVTGTSDDIFVTAPNTATPTPSSTPSVTPTHSSTPTRTPVPQGGACMDPAQCAGGLFCSQGVCCDTDCAGPNQSCAVPGREGQCVSNVPAVAPAMSATGLLSALATLIAIGALALVTRRRRYRT